MSSTNPDQDDMPESLPGTVWTRADALRVGDEVYVRDRDQDGPGEIVGSQIGTEHVLLLLAIDRAGTRVEHEQAPSRNSYYMRYVR